MSLSLSATLELLYEIGVMLQGGVLISGIGLIGYVLQGKLANHTALEEPDPTAFLRTFENIYQTIIDPVGRRGAVNFSSPLLRRTSYQLSIGIMVLAVATLTYTLFGGVLTGAVLVTNQASFFSIEAGTIFQQLVAIVVLVSWVVMSHAQSHAEIIECQEKGL